MAVTDYASVFGGAGHKNASAIIAALEAHGVYVVPDGENPQDLTAGHVTHIAYRGVVFWYDAADGTTIHDGTTCIVTADGKRFKSDGGPAGQMRFYKVADKDLPAPPGSPAIGTAYIVAAGGTAAWAGKDGLVATWTARGWMFRAAAAYDLAIVLDESAIYHMGPGGSWVSGFPFFSIGAGTVLPSSVKYGPWGLAVVNATTTAPPGSPSDGDAYVVAATATGAWTGHEGEIALWQSTLWAFYVPYEGASVYDKAIKAQIKFDGAVWVPQVSGYSKVVVSEPTAANISIGGSYAYSGIAPTSGAMTSIMSIEVTPSRAGALYEIEAVFPSVVLTGQHNSAGDITAVSVFGLFADAVSAAVAWHRGPGALFSFAAVTGQNGTQTGHVAKFIWQAPDDLAHTLTVRASKTNTFNVSAVSQVGLGAYLIARELS